MGDNVIQKYYKGILDLYPSWAKVRYLDTYLHLDSGIEIMPTKDGGYKLKYLNHQAIVYREEQYIVELLYIDRLTEIGKERRKGAFVEPTIIFYHLDDEK